MKKTPEGGQPPSTRVGARPLPCGPPSSPPVAIFCSMKSFTLEKNHKQAYGTKHRRHKAEPWWNQSRAPAELFCRGYFPPGIKLQKTRWNSVTDSSP